MIKIVHNFFYASIMQHSYIFLILLSRGGMSNFLKDFLSIKFSVRKKSPSFHNEFRGANRSLVHQQRKKWPVSSGTLNVRYRAVFFSMPCTYRKSELVAAVITIQSCSTSQYVRHCGISNSQYLMHVEMLSTFIDVRVIRPG